MGTMWHRILQCPKYLLQNKDTYITVDQDIFMLKVIHMKNVHCVKFSWFHLIHEIFNGWRLQCGRAPGQFPQLAALERCIITKVGTLLTS